MALLERFLVVGGRSTARGGREGGVPAPPAMAAVAIGSGDSILAPAAADGRPLLLTLLKRVEELESAEEDSPIKKMASVGSAAGIPVSKSLRKQASYGLIRKGGVESRIDVITRDYVPPATSSQSQQQLPQPRSEGKRSKSQPAVCFVQN